MNARDLVRDQREALWLEGHTGLYTTSDALSFLEQVGIALRYGAATNLALASMYRATQCQVPVPENEGPAHARAFELTNSLLASGKVVELNLFADRLSLAHHRIVPAIYALRRGQQEPNLSDSAREALGFIGANESATSGDVRRLLKAEGQRRPDAADLALAELQRALLIDRGPSAGPTTGVFYLTREGYPYRVFATAHPEIVSSAQKLKRSESASQLLLSYLTAAQFATRRGLVSLFKLLLTPDEINGTVESQIHAGRLERARQGRNEVIVYRT